MNKRNFILWFLFIVTYNLFMTHLLSKTLHKLEGRGEEKTIITMKDSKGEVHTYNSKEEVQFEGVKRGLPGGEQSWNSRLCQSDTPTGELDIAEAQIELDTLIDLLNYTKGPRKLSEYQRDFLSTIPPCAIYIVKLRIISRLLNGYDLINISSN